MRNIDEILHEMKKDQEDCEKPNSERADTIEQLMEFMGEQSRTDYSRRFRYWLGRTRKCRPADIHTMMGQAKHGRNPHALFNYLLKKYGKK